jgi:multiple sugar transport system permease protein
MKSEDRLKILLLLPMIVWILAITIFPLIFTVRLSFFDWHFGTQSKFFGFNNYLKSAADERVLNSLKVTIIYVLITVTAEVILGFFIALLFNKGIREAKFLRSFLTLPLFTAPVAVAYIGMILFHSDYGPVNFILQKLSFKPVNWLGNPLYAMISVILLDVWQWTPFTFIVILAGLQSLPLEPYESAKIDGANSWQLMRFLTIPMLAPVLITAITFKLVYSYKVFDLPYALTAGGPGTSTEVFAMYIHRQGLEFFNLGYAASLSLIFLIIVMVSSMMLLKPMKSVYEKK